MTSADREILVWIKKELGETIRKAVADSGTDFEESLLGAMVLREVGVIISRNVPKKLSMMDISGITRGDYTKRKNDKEEMYHGYSYFQIDIDSFPDFVKSGNWKDPYKSCLMAIKVLEGKRKYIASKCPELDEKSLYRATIAAYNYGEGTACKRIKAKQDIDLGTAHNNYSKLVLECKECYEGLFKTV